MLAVSLTVLIVDDDPDIRLLVRTIVATQCPDWQLAGEASNGEEAVAAARQHQPDVVVLDHRMPGMTGLDVAEQLLADDPTHSIILFSAYLSAGVRKRAESLGVCAILGKDEYGRLPATLERCRPVQPRKTCVTQ